MSETTQWLCSVLFISHLTSVWVKGRVDILILAKMIFGWTPNPSISLIPCAPNPKISAIWGSLLLKINP